MSKSKKPTVTAHKPAVSESGVPGEASAAEVEKQVTESSTPAVSEDQSDKKRRVERRREKGIRSKTALEVEAETAAARSRAADEEAKRSK